jgi:hypothetical protein
MYDQKSIFEELKPFASMVIDQGRGVTVSDLAFASAEDRYSTAAIALSTLTLPANSSVKLFQKNIGETGQGFTGALTVAETNNTSGDRMPSNQVYIGTHVGFQVYAKAVANVNVVPIVNPHSMYQICAGTVWNLTVGDGIKRSIGTVMEYPAGSGIDGMYATAGSTGINATTMAVRGWANNGWGGKAKRKLPIPIVWPPNVQVDIELQTGAAQVLLDNFSASGEAAATSPTISGIAIAYRMTFRGFRMTLPA